VGAIGTNLKVWNADCIGTYAAAAGEMCGFEGIFILYPRSCVRQFSSQTTWRFGKLKLKLELGQSGASKGGPGEL
jgi:hypothetical protein